MRDYVHIDRYLDNILGDIYLQPEDSGHTELAREVIDLWCSRLASCNNVLDVGCGTGFCQEMFEKFNIEYTGVCLGGDYLEAYKLNHHVFRWDFSFLPFEDDSYDLVFSRHSLEHSPMPLLTLMEWRRVAKNWLGLIVPAPEHYTFEGQNHYSIMTLPQVTALLPRAGWHVMWADKKMFPETDTPQEYWLFCEKVKEKIK